MQTFKQFFLERYDISSFARTTDVRDVQLEAFVSYVDEVFIPEMLCRSILPVPKTSGKSKPPAPVPHEEKPEIVNMDGEDGIMHTPDWKLAEAVKKLSPSGAYMRETRTYKREVKTEKKSPRR